MADEPKVTDVVNEPLVGRKQPKIVGYMASLYDAMSTEAMSLEAEDGQQTLIWQGRLIATCTSVGIPEGYYKKVVDALRKLGSIEIVSRGKRGSTLTVIVLRYPPTEELYEDAIVKSGWEGLTSQPSLDTLAAQVRDILKSIGGLSIVDAFKNQEDRLVTLETATKALQEKVDHQSQIIATLIGEQKR